MPDGSKKIPEGAQRLRTKYITHFITLLGNTFMAVSLLDRFLKAFQFIFLNPLKVMKDFFQLGVQTPWPNIETGYVLYNPKLDYKVVSECQK